MFCEKCGTENVATDKFCTSCGASLQGGSTPVSSSSLNFTANLYRVLWVVCCLILCSVGIIFNPYRRLEDILSYIGLFTVISLLILLVYTLVVGIRILRLSSLTKSCTDLKQGIYYGNKMQSLTGTFTNCAINLALLISIIVIMSLTTGHLYVAL